MASLFFIYFGKTMGGWKHSEIELNMEAELPSHWVHGGLVISETNVNAECPIFKSRAEHSFLGLA